MWTLFKRQGRAWSSTTLTDIVQNTQLGIPVEVPPKMTSLGQNGWKCQILCITAVQVSLQLLRAGVPALRVAVVRARPYTPAGSPPFF